MKTIILTLLRLFSPAAAAALEAYLGKQQEEVNIQVQEILTHEEKIDAAVEAEKLDAPLFTITTF